MLEVSQVCGQLGLRFPVGIFAMWRGRRFGAQLARLERQLARAPGNVESRSRLLLAYAGELIDDFLVKCWNCRNPKDLVNTEHLNCWLARVGPN